MRHFSWRVTNPAKVTISRRLCALSPLVGRKDAAVIRVDAKDFTDYAAIAFGPQPEGAEHTLAVPGERPLFFAFKNYGYARITNDGSVTLRGDWTGLRLPGANGPVMLNGKAATANINGGRVSSADRPSRLRIARRNLCQRFR